MLLLLSVVGCPLSFLISLVATVAFLFTQYKYINPDM
jgi:hypothetical protein